MKIREDFVTNSSSSSFIINKKHLNKDQIKAIYNHIELGKLMGWEDIDHFDKWNIQENDTYITGSTWMDNFDMYEFLQEIDVRDKCVDWSEFSFDLNNYSSKEYDDEDDIYDKTWRELLHEI